MTQADQQFFEGIAALFAELEEVLLAFQIFFQVL